MLPKVVKNLRIDLNLGQVRKSIAINQNSTLAPTLNVYLVDSGSPVSLEDLLYAEIFIHKADNHEAINGCVIDGDSIQYTLHSTDVSAVGINEAQLQLTWKDGSVAITPTFEIVVYQAVVDENVQQSQNEYTSLSQMVVQCNQYMEDAADSAEAADESADAAASSALEASGFATDAAGSAETAQSYADAAGRDADRSATNASIALTAESWATGQSNGVDVPDTAEQYHNNAKYYASVAGDAAASAASSSSETADDVMTATSLLTATSEAASEGAGYLESNSAIASEVATYGSEYAAHLASTSIFESMASSEASAASQYAIATSEAVTSASTYASTATSEAATATSEATAASNYAQSASEYAATASSQTAAGSSYASAAASCEAATSEYTSTAGSLTTAASEYNSSASEYASYASSEAVVAGDYAYQAQQAAQSLTGALKPMGTVTFANLPLLVNAGTGDMYNVSDAFTTTSDFEEGANIPVAAGSNVYKTAGGKWDVLAGNFVSGVKGDNESTYRQGEVNITKANIGLGNVDNESLGIEDISSIGDGSVKGAIKYVSENSGDYENLAPVESTPTASQSYAIGSHLIFNGVYYEVIQAIAQGETFNVGSNIEKAYVSEEIENLKNNQKILIYKDTSNLNIYDKLQASKTALLSKFPNLSKKDAQRLSILICNLSTNRNINYKVSKCGGSGNFNIQDTQIHFGCTLPNDEGGGSGYTYIQIFNYMLTYNTAGANKIYRFTIKYASSNAVTQTTTDITSDSSENTTNSELYLYLDPIEE